MTNYFVLPKISMTEKMRREWQEGKLLDFQEMPGYKPEENYIYISKCISTN